MKTKLFLALAAVAAFPLAAMAEPKSNMTNSATTAPTPVPSATPTGTPADGRPGVSQNDTVPPSPGPGMGGDSIKTGVSPNSPK